jgi:dienelactone hydrolase
MSACLAACHTPKTDKRSSEEDVMVIKRTVLAMVSLTILVVCIQTIAAQAVTIPSQTHSRKVIQLPGILHKPDGEGPFPAVLMLCGCAGYGSEPDSTHQSTWAERLVGWGYVALQLDSFSPRGAPNGVCDRPGIVYALDRADDAYSAKSYLTTLPFVDPKNIAVIGWSHGGAAVMSIVDGYASDKGVSPFKAAVAFYPYCNRFLYGPDMPVLVLMGKKDDWSPLAGAEVLKEEYKDNEWNLEFSLKVYLNATHAFDIETLPAGGVDFPGHHMEYDPEATSDAIAETQAFLAKYIGLK